MKSPSPREVTRIARQIFADVAALSPDIQGVSRPAYSAVESKVLDYLEEKAQQFGLRTWRDSAANLVIARSNDRDTDASCGLIGSHVDTVPQGGNFDGLAGVVAALVILIGQEREDVRSRIPVRALALRGEESAWFGQAYMGSRALLGRLTGPSLAAKRPDGAPLLEALRAVGADVRRIGKGVPLVDPKSLAFFLELHVEQGPVLVDRGSAVAAVTGIRGSCRHRIIQCLGEAGHSGTVPRDLRRDAVFSTSALIARMDKHWESVQNEGGDLVLTVGICHTDLHHNAMSRIPGEMQFSFEARSLDLATLTATEKQLVAECRAIECERNVRFALDERVVIRPASLDPGIARKIAAVGGRLGHPVPAMPSGAGHDSAVFAEAGVPTGMIFVRNRHGSHNPREQMDLSDFMVAVAILRDVANEMIQ